MSCAAQFFTGSEDNVILIELSILLKYIKSLILNCNRATLIRYLNVATPYMQTNESMFHSAVPEINGLVQTV